MKPVYMINGFLESGKTEFITFTLEQPYFQVKGKTLLILCEEGELSYEEELLEKSRTVLELVDEEEDFTPEYLMELEKKHKPERILIEYNGMWNYKDLRLPWHWKIEQQVTTIDASTFALYFGNMKSLLSEMVRKSELIIFNRCDGIEELASYKRNIKAINRRAEIVFEGSEGEIEELLEEELPFALDAPVIELDNQGYGVWFLDCLDHPERYMGKTVQFTGLVLKPDQFPEGYFVPGRMAMTCCADDMAFLGYACACEESHELEDGQWVEVTALVKKEYFADYGGEGPVLYAEKIRVTEPPEEEIISFV